jgi:ribonuclease BN (tRNA processing enzyme)
MKLQLIGTGSITAPQTSASSLIDDHILIDCGTGVIKELMKQKINIFDIDTILITHLHADHFFDLPYIILLRSFNQITNNLKIYGPKNLKKKVNALFEIGYADLDDVEKLFFAGNTSIVEFDNLEKEINGHLITSILVEHGETKPSYGYIIEKDGKKIGFSGDSCYCQAIDHLVDSCDVSVLECSFPYNSKEHMGPEIIEKLALKGKIIVTHMSLYTRKELKKRNIDNVTIGKDSDIFHI